MNKNQSGSAHFIVVIVLAIALIGALGWIFYQNFVLKPKQENQNVSQTSKNVQPKESKDLYSQVATNSVKNRKLSVNYPEGWSTKTEPNGDQDGTFNQVMSVTSPDSKYRIDVTLMYGGGLGGTCNTDDSMFAYASTASLPNYKDKVFLEYIQYDKSQYPQSYYMDARVISKPVDLAVFEAGKTSCSAGIGLLDNVRDDADAPIASAHIVFSDLEGADKVAKSSPEELKSLLETENYKIAKKIIISLREG